MGATNQLIRGLALNKTNVARLLQKLVIDLGRHLIGCLVVLAILCADFLIDRNYVFELGGKSKSGKQIHKVSSSYIVADDIEIGYQNKIPLYLFGFLY